MIRRKLNQRIMGDYKSHFSMTSELKDGLMWPKIPMDKPRD